MSHGLNGKAPSRIDLLSDRFARESNWKTKKLSQKQQQFLEKYLARIASGSIRFLSDPCPCQQGTSDTVISQRDRYGLPVDSVLCHECGTVRIDPYLDQSSLSDFYTNIYQELYGRSQVPTEYFQRQRTYGAKLRDTIFSDKVSNGKRVVEIGCGAGGGLAEFLDKGFDVAGCDYSDELIAFGTKSSISHLKTGTIDCITSDLGKFDLVYAHHVLEHVGDPLPTLIKMQKLAKPGGKVLIIVPELRHIENHKHSPSDSMEYFHVAHKYNFSRECLEDLGARAGLRTIQVHPIPVRTVWSDAPELWVLFENVSNGQPLELPVRQAIGPAILAHLKQCEANFQQNVVSKLYQKPVPTAVRNSPSMVAIPSPTTAINSHRVRSFTAQKLLRELKRPLKKLGLLK